MKAIVAVDKNWGIGCQGRLLERIPADMKFFKQTTLGKVVVMGRETFLSLPGSKPLKDRVNIVLCEDRQLAHQDIIICTSLDELFSEIKKYPPDEVFVIGGAMVYKELLPYCSEAYVTKIEKTYPADKHLDDLDKDKRWDLIYKGTLEKYNDIGYRLTKYVNRDIMPL